MKNLSKTIASIGMSLFAVGAMAQSPSPVNFGASPQHKLVKYVQKGVHVQGSQASNIHQAQQQLNNAFVEYPYWDDKNCTTLGISYQGYSDAWGAVAVNSVYALGDTGATKTDKNYELIQSVTVAFDSLYDVYSQSSLSPDYNTIATIDTLWALVSYKNSSHTPGLIIFRGLNTSSGYPGGTVLFTDTIKVGTVTEDTALGQNFGKTLDSGYYIAVLPKYQLNGKSFAYNLTYVGSKADTFEVFYGYPYVSCNNAEYPLQSTVGIDLAGLQFVNTFSTGWAKVFGKVTEVPTNTGGFVWFGVQCSDSTSYPEQDAAMYASFTYSSTTGINNITASGLSVAQNYPNPFNRATTINYSLTKASNVTFTVYDITGRSITTTNYGNVAPGQYQINLNANTFSPGVYFYTFNVGGSTVTKKMVITE